MVNRRTTKKAAPVRRGRVTRSARRVEEHGGILDFFRLSESYASLLLGLVVVIVAAVLLIAFFQGRRNIDQIADTQKATSSTQTVDTSQQDASVKAVAGRTYVVQAGDDLWRIAEIAYTNGYEWTRIAKANNITDPGMITAGQKLVIPPLDKELAQNITPTSAPTQVQPSATPSPTVTEPTPTAAKPTPTVAKASPTSHPTITPSETQKNTTPVQGTITGMTYTVAKGDYLWEIAERAYGDGYKWVEIARANHLTNPDVIHSGNVLQIPRKG